MKKERNPLPNSDLPPLPGSVCKQYRRRGDRVYGPYYFRFFYQEGRLRKQYVRRDQVEAVRAACDTYRQQRQGRRQRLQEAMAAFREITSLLRRIKADV